MSMNKEETKEEVQRLWINWSERRKIKDTGMNTDSVALAFYWYLKDSNETILSDGDFGLGDPYQIIHAWVLEWRRR